MLLLDVDSTDFEEDDDELEDDVIDPTPLRSLDELCEELELELSDELLLLESDDEDDESELLDELESTGSSSVPIQMQYGSSC